MGNYNNNNFRNNDRDRSSDRRDSGRPRFGSQNSGRTQMHDATCSDCGDNCKIPFLPTSGKPVYCSNCFEKRGNGRDNNRNDRPSFDRRDDRRDNRRDERRNDRPSFTPKNNASETNYDKQFEALNTKLDKILKALSAQEEVTPVKAKKEAKAVKVETETKVKTVKEKAAPKAKKPAKAKATKVAVATETASEVASE